jgi:predicted nucleic acid-binding protein
LQLVIADTGPVNYLILIGHIDILPALFHNIILPSSVHDELAAAPILVSNWIARPPSWIEIRQSVSIDALAMEALDAGEVEAIALALELHADLLLMDDREGVLAARRKGLEVIGTLGVLARAAKHNLIELAEAFDKLKQTNFRYRQETMDLLLKEAREKL